MSCATLRAPLRRRPRPDPSAALDAGRALLRPAPAVLGELRPVLREDLFSEYDGRFLTAWLRDEGPPLSAPAQDALAAWDRDERRHCEGFRLVLRCLWDDFDAVEGAALAQREPDFGPLAPLMQDELGLLLLAAYDELCTVRAYRRLLPHYAHLGPRFVAWIHEVVADEAWHYALFLGVLRSVHRARLTEAPARLARIRAAEGTPYAATFLLDHDDAELFSPDLCDQAQRVLLRQLSAPAG